MLPSQKLLGAEMIEVEIQNTPQDQKLLNLIRSKNLARFNVDRQNADKIMDRVGSWISLMESDRNPNAKNPKSTAAGAFQYTKGAIKTAVNRLKNTVGAKNLPDWAKKVQESGDARDLTLGQQQILFEADTFQKPGSDKFLTNIFNGNEDEVINLYKKLHHTEPDKSTLTRINELRPQLRLPQFEPQDTSDAVLKNKPTPPSEPVRAKPQITILAAEPVPRPQLASDIVEAAAVPAESGGISDLVSQVGSSLGFDRGSPRSTLAPSGLSEQEDARFNLLLQNLTGK
jgi:hypothetical protein